MLGETAGKVGGDAGVKAAVAAAQNVGVICRRAPPPLQVFRNSIPQLLKNAQLIDNRQMQARFPQGNRPFKMWQRALPGVKMFDILRLKHLMEGNGAE
ncbi:hypothetical protein SDC9_105982 [bioreactor metagenome]|uniref:Uncharacterized protein n=1 Tax=bioreactor metagenome TaxID=1076179 RepID=A0A645BBQ4_9ZZZZ